MMSFSFFFFGWLKENEILCLELGYPKSWPIRFHKNQIYILIKKSWPKIQVGWIVVQVKNSLQYLKLKDFNFKILL